MSSLQPPTPTLTPPRMTAALRGGIPRLVAAAETGSAGGGAGWSIYSLQVDHVAGSEQVVLELRPGFTIAPDDGADAGRLSRAGELVVAAVVRELRRRTLEPRVAAAGDGWTVKRLRNAVVRVELNVGDRWSDRYSLSGDQ